ncbi:MAG: sulfatase-like hydrolase/transferase [Bacteroidota bacterium]
MRKKYPVLIAGLVFGLLILTGWKSSRTVGDSPSLIRPNILLIVADDLGWGDVGYLGSEISTPNIDALAEEGIRLDRFYTAPICSPTRAGLLTGRYPDRYGLRNNVVRPWLDFGLDTNETTLPEVLSMANYPNRGLIGKWHLGHSRQYYHPLARGYTYFYGHLNGAIDYFDKTREGERDWHENYTPNADKGYTTDLITAKALAKLEEYQAAAAPFFLHVAYNAPHSPLQAQPKYLRQVGYDPTQPRFMRGRGKGNTKRQTYAAMVANMDDGIGQLLDHLDSLNISENTLVFFMSDNGGTPYFGGDTGGLRGRKLTEWEGGVRCPAILRWPAKFQGQRSIETPLAYIDLLPTLQNILGVRPADQKPLDGRDWSSVLLGRQDTLDRTIYIGNGVVLAQRWKYFNHRYTSQTLQLKKSQLFSIDRDERERNNLIDNRAATRVELQKELARFREIRSSLPPPVDARPEDFIAPPSWSFRADEE